MGELHVQSGLLDVRFRRLDQGPRAEFRLDLGIELASRDRSRFRQRLVSLDIEAGLAKLRPRLGELRLRLVERRLERTRVDLEEDVPFEDDASFPVRLPDDVPGNAGLDLRVHESVQRRHPFAIDRRVLLHDCGDFDVRRRRSRRTLVAAGGKEQEIATHRYA